MQLTMHVIFYTASCQGNLIPLCLKNQCIINTYYYSILKINIESYQQQKIPILQ